MERLPLWQIALRRIDMPVQKYIAVFIGGSFLAGLIVTIALISLTGGFAEGALFAGFAGVLLLIFLPLLVAFSAAIFPILEVQRSATLIEREMHMFITRMGILSLGEVGASTIFDILKQMSDYGELAKEVKRIEVLVDKWHTSLPVGSRIAAIWSPNFTDRPASQILLTLIKGLVTFAT